MILELVIVGIALFRSAVLSLCRWALSPPYALFSSKERVSEERGKRSMVWGDERGKTVEAE